MKLTCDSCLAKYSIADERVSGKLFKFRCKKCSHVIMVRGAAAEPAEAPPPSTASGEWHAVIDGQQVGPFDRAELVRRRDAGELGDDTFVWREGMPDWVPLGTVEEARVPEPATDATRLRNERNETSVLFTLGNLARLAAPAQPAQPATASAARPGEEGSGLIDIRALASTWAQPAASAKPSTTGSLDDLPVYALTAGVADPIVLVPTASRAGIDRRLLVALVAMLAMIATLATVLVVVLTRDGGTAQAAVAPAPVPAPVPVKVEAPAPPPPQIAMKELPPTVTPPPPPSPPPVVKKSSRKAPKLAATPEPPPETTCTEVSCMVNDNAGNCCDRFRSRKAPPPTTTTDLPDNLDRGSLAAGIATIKAQKCGTSSPAKGDVSVSVKVTAEGSVSTVTVKSSPDPALAACVVAEAKRGVFAKTKRGGSFSYFWRF